MKMKYNFIEYKPRYSTLGKFVYINKSNMGISIKGDEVLGKPERIDLYYDVDNKAIRIVKSQDGLKVTRRPNGGGCQFSTRLAKIMPTGRYEWIGDNIFVLDK